VKQTTAHDTIVTGELTAPRRLEWVSKIKA